MAKPLKLALLYFLLAQILLLQQAATAVESPTPEPSPSPVKVKPHAAGQTLNPKPTPSPVKVKPHSAAAQSTTVAPPPAATSSSSELSEIGEDQSSTAAQAPEIRRMGKHKSDKSEAGGGVIIGGLVTAIFAAVYCYIRVTRKRGGVY